MRALITAAGICLFVSAIGGANAQSASAAQTSGLIPVGVAAHMAPPEGWRTAREADLVRFTPPEGDFHVVVVPIAKAEDAADAVAKAWRRADPSFRWPVRLSQPLPAREGWDEAVTVSYEVPPAQKAVAQALALRHGSTWTVVTSEGAMATIAKREAQFWVSSDTLRPIDYVKENFAGKTAHGMDARRIEALKQFVRAAMTELKVPGVSLAVVDHDRIVYEGGIGVKDLATGAPVDKDTLFMVASNTKGMSTLLLASLVDEGKLDWNKPVVDYMPSFRLGSAETTRKVLVKHLVCACTGLPRKDMQWLFNTKPGTGPAETFAQLAATQPTSGFGEVFQYNNLMASAAGYLAAHILYPGMEMGAGYDRAMQERIFDPLGMRHTTFSTPEAIKGNWAKPYDTDITDRVAAVEMRYNDTVVPYRPAGGAWSSAHDMALYVRDELDEGALPGGKHFVSKQNVLARRAHNVPTGEDSWYGMGLEDDASKGVSVILHGGSLFGYKSNWFAVPAAKVGVVVLTNSDVGYTLANGVKRRLLELLYDGKPEAAENVSSAAKRADADLAKMRSEVDLHVTPARAKAYLGRYGNNDLGPLTIAFEGGKLMARATSFWWELAPKRNKDGSTSLITVSPGFIGLDFLVATHDGKRAIVLDDSQHEYVFKSSDEPEAASLN